MRLILLCCLFLNSFCSIAQTVEAAAEWRNRAAISVLATPVLHHGILYFGATDGNFYAVKQP